jgi:hypothetical protein
MLEILAAKERVKSFKYGERVFVDDVIVGIQTRHAVTLLALWMS